MPDPSTYLINIFISSLTGVLGAFFSSILSIIFGLNTTG